MPEILKDSVSLQKLLQEKRAKGISIALVPTMGALHEGHLSLVRIAREKADFVLVSIFVNPTQFGPGEDFEKYPRMLDEDAAKLGSAGADTVFAPDVTSMYPDGFSTWVTVEGLTDGLCGKSRPHHFRGVTTIVAKLFNVVRPDFAVFGRKDAQQLAVIRRMARDLDMGIEIIGGDIVREPDGLAMSSRNSYLSADERKHATVLHESLLKARQMAGTGEIDAGKIIGQVRKTIEVSPLAKIEYVEIVDADDMTQKKTIAGNTLLALAVRFGTTRLIDNTILSGMQ